VGRLVAVAVAAVAVAAGGVGAVAPAGAVAGAAAALAGTGAVAPSSAFAGAAAALVGAGTAAPSAIAGEYHVYSCRTPSGEAAPADGWSGSAAIGKADDIATNSCAQGGALTAALGDQTTHIANTESAMWAFEAPAGDRLVGAALWRAGYLHGTAGENATYQFWLAGPIATDVFSECLYTKNCSGLGDTSRPLSSANELVVPSANLGSLLTVDVACATGLPSAECRGAFGDPNGYAAVVYLYAADLTLEQSTPPTASNVSGELVSASTLIGTSDVAFSATDPGSGVYEAVFSVDGKVVQSTVIDEDGGRCRNVGQTSDGLAAFLYVQPCPASVSADVGFDSTAVPNGVHHLVVSVIDAAGNAATVLDRNISVENAVAPGVAGGPRGPNGVNASARAGLTVRWQTTGNERLTSGFGHAETILGRLTRTDGVPITGALVIVLARPSYAGAQTAALTSVRTDANGRFALRLPSGSSSRTLRFAYSDQFGAPAVVTKTLMLSVRAGVSLSIAPRTAHVGSSIYFSGRLRGGPVPRGGKLLVLEARSLGGAWLEFNVIRSSSRGRFRASYRFKFAGPAEYQFRVLCEAEADYPYATGASNVVGVFER
jgi:hypothetical protein